MSTRDRTCRPQVHFSTPAQEVQQREQDGDEILKEKRLATAFRMESRLANLDDAEKESLDADTFDASPP
ncbi:hypothetical protein [Candidatus Laterigemmans baculatus]|uniref:hypothetical protein n=1 Tax=Candidatus Laterigemmans baculatus TaxID=2770505 RepID=UPI00193BCD13|nr:hypothetical protein [Candidatus Laterigemmans baculatus]